jgi:signal transduction histidine kinase
MIDERDWLAARGVLAGGVAGELAGPLARVQKILAEAVDQLDHHVAHSKGPEPLPWTVVSQVREELMDAYLDIGRAARLAGDLAAVAGAATNAEADLNDIVERAVALARHRIGRDCELLLDLGSLLPVRLDGARVAQAVAHLILASADEADTGTTIVLRTAPDPDGTSVVVSVTHSLGARAAAAGSSHKESPFGDLVRESIATEGGRLAYVRNGDQVTAEIVFPASKK